MNELSVILDTELLPDNLSNSCQIVRESHFCFVLFDLLWFSLVFMGVVSENALKE